jgi:hypothetical protein
LQHGAGPALSIGGRGFTTAERREFQGKLGLRSNGGSCAKSVGRGPSEGRFRERMEMSEENGEVEMVAWISTEERAPEVGRDA